MEQTLPGIPAKRYFTIGEVADLCGVKPHVLRYWEQEFTQLRPMKRRGNRRYYQHHEVLMIRHIRDLLYEQGFTINGARNKMQEILHAEQIKKCSGEQRLDDVATIAADELIPKVAVTDRGNQSLDGMPVFLRRELLDIRDLLSVNG